MRWISPGMKVGSWRGGRPEGIQPMAGGVLTPKISKEIRFPPPSQHLGGKPVA